jgi:hypothetical protein
MESRNFGDQRDQISFINHFKAQRYTAQHQPENAAESKKRIEQRVPAVSSGN